MKLIQELLEFESLEAAIEDTRKWYENKFKPTGVEYTDEQVVEYATKFWEYEKEPDEIDPMLRLALLMDQAAAVCMIAVEVQREVHGQEFVEELNTKLGELNND